MKEQELKKLFPRKPKPVQKPVRMHADFWKEIERAIKATGTNFNRFTLLALDRLAKSILKDL